MPAMKVIGSPINGAQLNNNVHRPYFLYQFATINSADVLIFSELTTDLATPANEPIDCCSVMLPRLTATVTNSTIE